MSSFMRFFRGASGDEEQQQPQRQQQGRPAQSSQQQRPSSSSSSSRGGGGGPASPPKAGAGQQKQHNKRAHGHGHGHGQKPAAATAAERPSPSRGGKAAKTGDGTMSPMSAIALKQLQGYSDQLDGLEDEVRAIEAALRDRRTPRARLLEAKDAVAQLNGSLEKLQFVGIDSVTTAELGEGKELAKETRKSLNKRCDALRDRILQAREALGRILATSP